MMLNVGNSSSCAICAIDYISQHDSPEEIMANFCSLTLGYLSSFISIYPCLHTFYVFTAGPEVKSTEKGGSHHSKDSWPTYGTDFAAFIVENKLGTVATPGPHENRRSHPGCTAQAWLWAPDQKAVEAWWNENQKHFKRLREF